VRKIHVGCATLNNLQELATSRWILPFAKPRPEALTITSDSVEGTTFLLVEIEDPSKAAELTAGARDLDASKSGR
jgi:hypothetical protein